MNSSSAFPSTAEMSLLTFLRPFQYHGRRCLSTKRVDWIPSSCNHTLSFRISSRRRSDSRRRLARAGKIAGQPEGRCTTTSYPSALVAGRKKKPTEVDDGSPSPVLCVAQPSVQGAVRLAQAIHRCHERPFDTAVHTWSLQADDRQIRMHSVAGYHEEWPSWLASRPIARVGTRFNQLQDHPKSCS